MLTALDIHASRHLSSHAQPVSWILMSSRLAECSARLLKTRPAARKEAARESFAAYKLGLIHSSQVSAATCYCMSEQRQAPPTSHDERRLTLPLAVWKPK